MIRSITNSETPHLPAERGAVSDWSPARVLARLASQPLDASALVRPQEAKSTLAHVTDCLAQALPESKSRAARIKIDLKRAGAYEPFAYQKLAALRYAGMMLSLVVFGTLTIFVPKQAEFWCVLGVVVGMLASWALPVWRLRRQAARRTDRIEEAIPDLSDLFDVCLSQGLTAMAGLATAGRELQSVSPELAQEIAIVCRQAELTSLDSALDDFERRIDLPEIRSFVTRVLQADSAQAR
jgi:tight adherence protein C